MKAGLFVAAALVQLAAAQPHRYRHQHLHEKRDIVTEIDYVYATTPDVVVYVDQFGNPLTTSVVNPVATTSTAEPSSSYVNPWIKHHKHSSTTQSHAAASTSSSFATSATSVAVASSATSVAVATSATSAAPAASSSASSGSTTTGSSISGYGITYSPYNADGSCKTQSEVDADFQQLGDYGLARMYGVDCNQLYTVGSAAIAKGMKLFAGVYDIDEVESQVAQIIAYAAGNWDNFHTISIGNELINSGQASVSAVVAAVNTARSLLTAAGYTGSVVTVDTWNAVLNNPELCECSDYAAINAHAFFDSSVSASGAGTWAANTAAAVKSKCGKETIITESGWPSQGQSNGAAVPSVFNQAAAVTSLKGSVDAANLILFTAYNDFWKSDFQGSFEAEHYWGILGTSSQ